MNATQTEAEIWDRAIQPDEGGLTTEAAHALLKLKLASAEVQRVNELSAKARAGALSAAEERQLDSYLNMGRALELLKAKARASLLLAVLTGARAGGNLC
jgi:hypothetical protein